VLEVSGVFHQVKFFSHHVSHLKLLILIASVCPDVCLFVFCEQDYVERLQAFFLNTCWIVDYCYVKKKLLNFSVDPNQNGRVAAIFNFHYSAFHIRYFRQQFPGLHIQEDDSA